MIKVFLFVILCLHLSSVSSRTFPNETEQETLNRVAVKTDTIFKGRILRTKTIYDGVVYSDGEKSIAGVLEVEVLKIYRGKLQKNDKRILCIWTWQIPGATINFPVGEEDIFFGVRAKNDVILIPDSYGFSLDKIEKESRLYKALKLKTDIFKDLFSSRASEKKLIRNACYEPVKWE